MDAKPAVMMSACGVLCSECPAYHAAEQGRAHQERTVEAWRRIYGLSEIPKRIACGGCLGPDEELFHTSRNCKARRCCLNRGLRSCAECPKTWCDDLEAAQKVWDEVPELAKGLSAEDFDRYARAYCGHRARLASQRDSSPRAPRSGGGARPPGAVTRRNLRGS